LVDTSVWVTAKRGRDPSLAKALAALVLADQVLGHDLVYLELLLGQGGDTRRQVLEDYRRLQKAVLLPSDEVAAFAQDQELANRGLGAVDVHLLAAARTEGARVWTLDGAMAKAAASLGLAYTADTV
jgi:hypothetical protein